MNLLRLLTTTHTFRDVPDKPAPFRMVEGLLPAFGPKTNVFAAEPAEQAGPTGARSRLDRVRERIASWTFLWRQRSMDGHAKKASDRPPCSQPGEGGAQGCSRRATKPASIAEVQPVQRELALEAVRVVRNDLRAEDLEVELAQPSLFGQAPGRTRRDGLAPRTSAPTPAAATPQHGLRRGRETRATA